MAQKQAREASMETPEESSGFAPCGRIEACPRPDVDDPFRPRWMDISDLKAGSLSEVLTKIERDGLIERTRDPQDRRQLIVRLTPEGHKQATAEQLDRERFRAEALCCLTDAECEQLEDMLARIKQHWKEIEPDMKGDCACKN